jgi:hypothetical protein
LAAELCLLGLKVVAIHASHCLVAALGMTFIFGSVTNTVQQWTFGSNLELFGGSLDKQR